VPTPNKMDQDIASAINRELFHQQAPAHIRIMNTRRNAKGAITTLTNPNAAAQMTLRYCDIIIPATRTVDKGVVDARDTEFWESLKMGAVPLVWYMGNGTQALLKMREVFATEKRGEAIPTEVRSLANPCRIGETRQNGVIAALSAVFVVKGRKVAKGFVMRGIKAAGVWYRVDTYTNEGPDSSRELYSELGHIENKCGSKPTCSYCSGHHQTSDHNCNVAGCTAKQGSLGGHTLGKCPNCEGNHIVCTNRSSARCKSVRKPYANLPDTPISLTRASKYFQTLPKSLGALQSALRLCKSIHRCS